MWEECMDRGRGCVKPLRKSDEGTSIHSYTVLSFGLKHITPFLPLDLSICSFLCQECISSSSSGDGIILILHLLEAVADSIIPTYSSLPLLTPSHLAGLTSNCLHLHFFTWGFFSSHMSNRQEMPRNVLLNTLHLQQLSTKNWPCFRNIRAPASLGWNNSEAMFNTISKSSPGGFICSCPSDSMVDKTPLIGSSPSLSHVPTTLPVILGIPFQINYCAGILTSEYFPEEPNWERGFSGQSLQRTPQLLKFITTLFPSGHLPQSLKVVFIYYSLLFYLFFWDFVYLLNYCAPYLLTWCLEDNRHSKNSC